jgi:C-terminal processing protease CtpA/Prc
MAQQYSFHATLLESSIGYIRIVGLPTGDNMAMAQEIQDSLCYLSRQGATSWVIDLRYNGGGNIYPMAEGIATLIGDGSLGGTKGLTEDEYLNWHIENGNFHFAGYTIGLPNSCSITDNPKVAVLTSVYTASSGEAMAVIFKGREQTRFFGQKTLGLITTTDYYPIDEQTMMTLSVGYYQDRNGNIYDKYVDVDVELPFAKTPLSEDDTCLAAALEWLKEQ